MDQKIMKALARKTDDAFEKEYEELNEVGKGFSPQLDAKLLEAAKFYDMQYAAGQKKRKSRQMSLLATPSFFGWRISNFIIKQERKWMLQCILMLLLIK